jgi:hypothetical protein
MVKPKKEIIMDNFKSFLSKYKVWILAGFIAIFFIRSCNRGRSVTKLNKTVVVQTEIADSLQTVIGVKTSQIDSFPEILRTAKLNIYLSLDDTISRVDRSPQLMGLHAMIKDEVKALQK